MKAMKGLSVNRVMNTIKKRTGSSVSGPDDTSASRVPENETPEAIAVRCVRLFCESGGPNAQGDEVLYLPPIVDAAESSPVAAAECARVIRKYLAKDSQTKATCQYNAIMLIRILTDNPGPTFTRNMDKKFVDTVKELHRSTRDPSVSQILSETLDSFEATKSNDQDLGELIAMWKKEKERSYKLLANSKHPPTMMPVPRMIPAPVFNPQSDNYFARKHSGRSLPNAVELASRLEEARTSAKLLSQVVINTPPQEVMENDLIKEFADRCQSASRSIQSYMVAENPSPDNDTMEHLIDTNEQLQSALNQHQRAVLGARKQLNIGPQSDSTNPARARPAEHQHPNRSGDRHPQEWQQAQSSSSSSMPASAPPRRPSEGNGKGKASESSTPPPGHFPKAQQQGPNDEQDPFRDPPLNKNHSSSRGAGGSGSAAHASGEEALQAHGSHHPSFQPTPGYLGRQESALGKITMHGADATTPSGSLRCDPTKTGNRQATVEDDSDDDLYESTPRSYKKKEAAMKY